MATNRYSLADYIVTLSLPSDFPSGGSAEALTNMFPISIGGPGTSPEGKGSFLGQISITRNQNAWDTEGDHTGSWVHNKNNDKTGTCSIDIRQISDQIIKLAQVSAVFESIQDRVPGFTLQVTAAFDYDSTGSNIVATCNDCYIQKIPDIVFGNEAATQSWDITCGQVFFYQ